MWNSFRSLLQPWQTMSGWEFDLLRSLPSDVAKKLYETALRQATLEMMKTWKWWVLLGLALCVMGLSLALVWVVAANQGFGLLGRIALEVAFHATLGLIILHPLARYQQQFMFPFVREALADEFYQFIRGEKLEGLEIADVESVFAAMAEQVGNAGRPPRYIQSS